MSKEVMNQSNQPEVLYADVSVRSQGGSLFDATDVPTADNVEQYFSTQSDIDQAEEQLIAAGFTVLGKSEIGLSIAGPVALYEQVFQTKIFAEERLLEYSRREWEC